MTEVSFWQAFWDSDAAILIAIGFMFGAFEKVLDLIIELRDWFNPLFVIDEFEEGVVLRFGRYNRTVKPGLHWKWPCSIEDEIKDTVVRTTSYLDVQSLTTRDGYQVNSSPVVIWKIGNIKRWLLEVDDAEEAVMDLTYGLNDALTSETDLKDIHEADYAEQLTALVAEEAVNWGARVLDIKFSDRARSKSLRLWTGGAEVYHAED